MISKLLLVSILLTVSFTVAADCSTVIVNGKVCTVCNQGNGNVVVLCN